MNIAYACDDNYIAHTGISILSLLENNTDIELVNIYLISVNISENNINKIKDLVDKFGRNLIVINFNDLCPDLKLSNVGRHIETVYAKLFFGRISNVDKMIYLDSDIIINGSLSEMWNIDITTKYFGLVKTVTKDYCVQLGLPVFEPFYNDGVAVVNCKLLREDHMDIKFLEFINLYNGNPPVLSEGTINVVCKNHIETIHPKFNFGSSLLMFNNKDLSIISNELEFYPDKLLNEAKNSPIVIHYLTGWYLRPWEQGCTHPLKEYYERFKMKSVWKSEPLQYKVLPKKLKFLKQLSKFVPFKVIKFFMDFYRENLK
jgi:lipopolysaccharide biosynthesis glycosyltransferase